MHLLGTADRMPEAPNDIVRDSADLLAQLANEGPPTVKVVGTKPC